MATHFNSILSEAGIDPAGVRLLRHVERRARRTCYEAALRKDPRFDAYQESQDGTAVVKAFKVATHIAGFVVDPDSDEVVFAGLWEVLGPSKRPAVNPFLSPPDDVMTGKGCARFSTRRVEGLDKHRGQVVIEWGRGRRAWVQRADLRDKPIIAMRRRVVNL